MASDGAGHTTPLDTALVAHLVCRFLSANECLALVRSSRALRNKDGLTPSEQRIGLRISRTRDATEMLERVAHASFARFSAISLSLLNYDADRHSTALTKCAGGSLQALQLRRCCALPHLGSLGALRFLLQLDLYSCRQLVSLEGVASLHQLRRLVMRFCVRIADVAPLAALPALTHVDVSGCTAITTLMPLTGCAALRTLVADRNAFTTLPLMRTFRSPLVALRVAWCRLDENDPANRVSSLQLRSLDIQYAGCSDSGGGPRELVTTLPFLGPCPQLRELDASGCKAEGATALVALADLCPALQELRLRDLPRLCGLNGIGACAGLRSLSLDGAGLFSLDGLRGCARLSNLSLRGCEQLTSVAAVCDCPALITLELSGCVALQDLSGLERCPVLRVLRCFGCATLANVGALAAGGGSGRSSSDGGDDTCNGTPMLSELELGNCKQLSSVASLAFCTRLHTLGLSGCTGLTEIVALAGNTQHLASLSLSNCTGVTDVACLATCAALETLNIEGIPRVRGTKRVRACCTRLHTLSVSTSAYTQLGFGDEHDPGVANSSSSDDAERTSNKR